MSDALRAPFPWFGGKRRVASVVWRAFGSDVPNYIEPCFGSGAVLLGRPGGAGKIETVNDVDRFLANFWRAVTANPLEVAKYADWPVNEADLHARHAWLVEQLPRMRVEMHKDPHWCDPLIAGWWVWGICQWIGGGWCVEPNNHKHPKLDGIGKGVHANAAHQLPHLSVTDGCANRGVHAAQASTWKKRPELDGTSPGRGVHSEGAHKQSTWNGKPYLNRRPAMSSAGQGVHLPPGRLPSLGNDRGLHGVVAIPALAWFEALQARLRRVRVACGDWKRVLGPSVLGKGKNVGGRRPCAVFLDPPYSHDVRDPGLYADDVAGLSDQVREWALAHGDDPDLRIALCGYDGEHEMPSSWTEYAWKAARGYASESNDNRERERIWFSPHCLPIDEQLGLFACAP